MNRKFRIGDKVKVVSMSPVTFAPSVKDELGTEKLFKSMFGKVYTVRGFDRYGNVELQPKPLNTVWVEPEFLKLRARKRKPRCDFALRSRLTRLPSKWKPTRKLAGQDVWFSDLPGTGAKS